MNWIWIPALAILAFLVLLLCWLFFKDYTCCPCERNRQRENDVSFVSIDIPPTVPTPYYPGRPPLPSAPPPLPSAPPSLARQYTLSPTGSPNLHFRYADLPVSEVISWQRGVPQLDLHQMTVKEATLTTNKFLRQSLGRYRKVFIVTGRGMHSQDGVAKVKPAIAAILRNSGYNFREVHNGGCYEVFLA